MKNEMNGGNLRIEDRIDQDENGLYERSCNEYMGEKSLQPDCPRKMLLEVTSACNHNCIFCANSKKKKKHFIDYNIAIKCLNEAFEMGIREVGLFARGEPLLDKNIVTYVMTAKNIGYEYVYITSNGALLNEQLGRKLIDAGLDSFKFSINAGNKRNYIFVHGKDDFDTVYNNSLKFDDYRKKTKSKCKLYISSVLTKYTTNDPVLIRKRWGDMADEIEFFNVVNHGGNMPENSELYIAGTNTVGTGGPMCMMPFNTINVTAEGYVDLCCVDYFDYLVIGDLRESSLSEIWNSEIFRRIRERFISGELGNLLCRNCMSCDTLNVIPINRQFADSEYIYKMSKKTEVNQRKKRYINNEIDD